MRNKKIVFVAFMIAMVALTQIQIGPVLAVETPLYPVVSGSDVDNQTFESDGHLVTDGFAAAITMDLPVDEEEEKHARVAFAVGLGDSWVEIALPYVYFEYTPYVKEMWLKVEGDGDYEPSPGVIVDNTGTGGPSLPDFWFVLELAMLLFDAYEIANFLMEVYQEPPSQEWIPEIHSVKAIVRQGTEAGFPIPYVNPDNPRLQTASAWLDSYFKRDGPNTLTITAEAEIYLQMRDVLNNMLYDQYMGTYSVSYEVEVPVGENLPPATPSTPSGHTTVYRNVWYNYSTTTTDPDGDDVCYEFEFTGPIPTVSFTTGWYASGETGSITVEWWDSDPLGTYQIRVRAQDVPGQWSDWSSSLAVSLIGDHDVAVTDVTVSPTSVRVGERVDISVDAKNEGDYAETFDLTIYYDGNIIATKTTTLDPGWTLHWGPYWITTGVPAGTYTIKAVASTVPGETDTADNTYVDGTVEVIWVHDVAVTSVTASPPIHPTKLNIGESVTIDVTAKNEGDYTETFDVTTYYNSTVIGTQTVTNLAPGTSTLTFIWDTTGMSGSQAGDYTIKAVASTVSGETDTADNTYIDGTVKVKIPGDGDFNGYVEMDDFYIWRANFGKHEGEWPSDVDPDYDNNGLVEMYDFFIWRANFGHW